MAKQTIADAHAPGAHRLDQMQPAARRLQLVPGRDVGRARWQAEAAMDAVPQILGGWDVGTNELERVGHR